MALRRAGGGLCVHRSGDGGGALVIVRHPDDHDDHDDVAGDRDPDHLHDDHDVTGDRDADHHHDDVAGHRDAVHHDDDGTGVRHPEHHAGIDDLAQVTVAPDGDGSDVPLGTIDTSGAVPEDLDVTAFPGAPGAPPAAGDGPTFAAGFSCAYQCIKSGVAYPRGIGALLVVETHVPARLFMSVVDADNDLVDATNSTGMVSDFSWALDHLEPGQTYFAMVAATDENDDTVYAYGHFFTLSERTVHVSIGDLTVTVGRRTSSTPPPTSRSTVTTSGS